MVGKVKRYESTKRFGYRLIVLLDSFVVSIAAGLRRERERENDEDPIQPPLPPLTRSTGKREGCAFGASRK